MTLRNRSNPSGFSKLFAPLLSIMMNRANNTDLKKKKEILESRKIKNTRFPESFTLCLVQIFFEIY